MIDVTTDLDALHRIISRYVNSGCLSSRDKYVSLLSSNSPFCLNAEKIRKYYREASASAVQADETVHIFDIPLYAGKNRFVQLMMEYLDQYLKDYLYGAYVHGSLGTYDEIPYSDFDAIVILSDEVFGSKRDLVHVASRLHDARRIMTDFDPLQHHGWFSLVQFSLDAYPSGYFPPELFGYAKALLPDKGRQLTIRSRANYNEYRNSFNRLATNIIEQLSLGHPRNVFQLKSLLSEFMLLPACYVQARDGVGIYKKFSFESARRDFSEADWGIMNEVSTIRERWHFRLGKTRRWLITRNTLAGRRMAQRYAPRIPAEFAEILTDEFYLRMQALATEMQLSIMGE